MEPARLLVKRRTTPTIDVEEEEEEEEEKDENEDEDEDEEEDDARRRFLPPTSGCEYFMPTRSPCASSPAPLVVASVSISWRSA